MKKSSNSKYIKYAKSLVDMAPNLMTNSALSDEFFSLGSIFEYYRISEGIPLVHAVDEDGFVLVADYVGDPKRNVIDRAIVGKGVTFDSGGYNIKTRDMWEMKSDMAGAAAVIAAMKFVKDAKPKLNYRFVIPVVQNLVGLSTTLPGSEIVARNGQLVEIRDTDAEGRLILADAVTIAQGGTQKVTNVYTIATLTGSCAYALGKDYIGLFAHCDMLKVEKGNDKLWQMPVKPALDTIEKQLKKEKKLINYVGKEFAGAYGYAFINNFINKDVSHVHLDIAGTAFVDGKATGSGVDYLIWLLGD